jgi:hypothetical protein
MEGRKGGDRRTLPKNNHQANNKNPFSIHLFFVRPQNFDFTPILAGGHPD